MPTISEKSINKLLMACAKCGVSHLKWGELEVSFNGMKENVSGTPRDPWVPPALSEETLKKFSSEQLLVDEARLKESQLAMMPIENPVEYERLLMEGKLGDENEEA